MTGVRVTKAGSRWHRHAFTSQDKGKDITVQSTSQGLALLVDGVERTEVTTNLLLPILSK